MSEEPKKLGGAFWPFLLLSAAGIISIVAARDQSAIGVGVLMIGAACLVILVAFVVLAGRPQGPK